MDNSATPSPTDPNAAAAIGSSPRHDIPMVKGLPLIGSTLEMARDPGRFFARCYREYGPVYRFKIFGRSCTVLAGPDAAHWMGTREGKECLRSKEFWEGLLGEYGASQSLPGLDGERHKQLRDVLRHGYSRESIIGRYNELIAITDGSIERDWPRGEFVYCLPAMQMMVTDQLGTILTGRAPLEYVADIRITILNILNVLITRQRPRFFLWNPAYQRGKRRVFELGDQMVADYRARGPLKEGQMRTMVDDIMEAHDTNPGLMPKSDLRLQLTAPYVAGLDTVANTTATIVYLVLKHPDVLKRIHAEVDALFVGGRQIEESELKQLTVLNGAIMESMRMYPIAVAQMRTATRDFVWQGFQIKADEMLYMATAVPHYMHEFYPEPDKFDPDRYDKARAEHMQSGAYSPYGRGPHTCLGKSLAEVQLLLSMARLFWRLDLALESPDYVLKTKTAPTPGPHPSFKVRVRGYRH
ncbi:MAG: cytochrome P450 [Nevskia sp.]|nr:cytochrome P450 [Nevskia sp.]